VNPRGPWFISAISAGVDWQQAAAALVAAAEVRVALVALDPGGPPVPGPATTLEVRDPADLTLADAAQLVRAVTGTHGLTLVPAGPGFLMPVGRDGWTFADLAAATGGGAVVVAGPGPDAVNHTTLALGALAGHGIGATVVTIGDVDESALPVTPAGRIPPDADLTEAAGWFDPLLRGVPPDPPPAPARPPVSGKKLVLGLLGVFLVMVLLVCGMAFWGSTETEAELHSITVTDDRPVPPFSSPEAAPFPRGGTLRSTVPVTAAPDRAATDACPQNAAGVTPTRPAAATTARVDAAWRRIEKWLAKHAPVDARTLRPPAPAEDVDALQRQMSVAFPPDLVASLRRHDGLTGYGFSLPPFFEPSSLVEIRSDWVVNCGVLDDQDTSWTEAWWDRRFVPFAAAGDGGSLVVDQRPGGHGRVGEFYAEDGTSFERWPASVTALLEGTASALETGRPYAGQYTPKAIDGRLDWDIR
jgi:cell wall assembly regulator SMI1